MTTKTLKKITMPQLGESVVEGTINAWLIKEGDHVNKYDPIADVMTDKVNAEVPSFFSGTITKIIPQEGDTIAVGDVMCYIETNDANISKDHVDPSYMQTSNQEEAMSTVDTSMKQRYSPAVLRMSQEHNIDLTTVKGTGKGGRITRKDLEKIIAKQQQSESSTVEAPVSQPNFDMKGPSETTVPSSGDISYTLTGVRKVIAQNMVKSKHEIPHAWMTIEVDVTDLVAYRNKIKDEFRKREGFNLTYFSFFVKAVAQALKEFPQLNSVWAEDKDTVIQRKDINLSIAVARENELFVPVIKQADEKSIKGIAKNIRDLATKAREGNLTVDDMQGGTFTINNSGSFGSIHSMGVINYPQIAILQVEAIVKRPVIINDMFAARDMVNLSLSLDHRVLDGLISGRFLARVKEILEQMNEKTLNIF